MIGNKIENYKLIGVRDMNMNSDLKTLFNEIDSLNFFRKPYFNDAKESFKISFSRFIFGLTILNTIDKRKQVRLGNNGYPKNQGYIQR